MREVGVVSTEHHVVPHGSREQRRILERHRDVLAEFVTAQIADVDAVEADRASCDVVEPGREFGKSRLAGTGEPDQCHRLAWDEPKLDPVQLVGETVGSVRIAEMDVVEDELSLRPPDRLGLVRIGDRVDRVDDLEEAVDRGARVECHRKQEADRLDREEQHGRGREERDQSAHVQLMLSAQPHSDEKADRESDVGHHQQPQPDAGHRLGLLDLRTAQRLRLIAEVAERVPGASEGLQHADAVHRLLDSGRQVAGLVLTPSRDFRIARFEHEAVDPQRDRAHDEDQAQDPVQRDEDDEPDRDGDEVHDQQHQAEGQPPAHLVQVAHRARQQLAARPLVVEAHGQVLKLGVKAVAHRRLDVCSGLEYEPAAQRDEECLRRAEDDDQDRGRRHLFRVLVRKGSVDQPFEDLRNAQGDEAGEERGHHPQNDPSHGVLHIGADPQQRADGSNPVNGARFVFGRVPGDRLRH